MNSTAPYIVKQSTVLHATHCLWPWKQNYSEIQKKRYQYFVSYIHIDAECDRLILHDGKAFSKVDNMGVRTISDVCHETSFRHRIDCVCGDRSYFKYRPNEGKYYWSIIEISMLQKYFKIRFTRNRTTAQANTLPYEPTKYCTVIDIIIVFICMTVLMYPQ